MTIATSRPLFDRALSASTAVEGVDPPYRTQPIAERRGKSRLASTCTALLVATAISGCAMLSPKDSGEAQKAKPLIVKPKPAQARLADGSTTSPAADPLPHVALTEPVLFQLLLAEVALQRQQVGMAITSYLGLARQTRDPRLARRATELALAVRSMDRALEAAKIWQQTAPSSAEARQTADALQALLGKIDDLYLQLVQRREQARANNKLDAFYAEAVQTLARAQDKHAALAMGARLIEPDRNLASARLMLAQLAASAGDRNQALDEVEAALQLRPDWAEPVLFAVQAMYSDAALQPRISEMVARMVRRNPEHFNLRLTYARMLAGEQKTDEALVEFKKLREQRPEHPPTLLGLGLLSYQKKLPDDAEKYLKEFLERRGEADAGAALLYLGQIAEDRKDWKAAEAWLAQIQPGPQFLPSQLRRATLLQKMGQSEAGIKLLQELRIDSPQEKTQIILAEVQLLKLSERNEEALKVLDTALQEQPTDPDLLYDHAMTAEKLDRMQLAEASLRKVIELKPDHAHAYNALGYSLADRRERLDEAKALIEKAVNLSPDDPFIIDSMGWVNYRMGNLPEAEKYLRMAWAKRQDAEIGAHLGEVLWEQGKKKEAEKLWRDALKATPDNSVLRKTMIRYGLKLD